MIKSLSSVYVFAVGLKFFDVHIKIVNRFNVIIIKFYMINVAIEECQSGNIKHKKNKKHRLVKIVISVLLVGVLFFSFMHFLITPIIVKTSLSKINEISNISLNSAITKVLTENVFYDDLINITYDSNGKITMLQANSLNINILSRKVVDYTYDLLFAKLCKPLQIPLGSFSGVPAFASLGPIISIDIVPYGNVFCTFKSQFVSVGINQTIHKIYLNITSDVSVVLPISKVETSNIAEAIVCESIIVGEIPETYLVAETTSDLLNMIG